MKKKFYNLRAWRQRQHQRSRPDSSGKGDFLKGRTRTSVVQEEMAAGHLLRWVSVSFFVVV